MIFSISLPIENRAIKNTVQITVQLLGITISPSADLQNQKILFLFIGTDLCMHNIANQNDQNE